MRHTPDRNDQPVEGRLLRGTGRVVVLDDDLLPRQVDTGDRDSGMDRETLLRERPLRFLRDRLVRRGQQRGQRLEHGRLRAQPAPHAAHLEPDHARADHPQSLRDLRHRERAGVVQHPHVVERDAGQRARRRSRGDDHVRCHELGGLFAVDLDGPPGICAAAGERAAAMEERDLVLAEQEQDAVVVLADDLLLARLHPRHVDREAVDRDAVVGEAVPRVLEVLGGLQQRLRRDAADVRAGAAGRGLAAGARPVVDAGRPESELRAANRGDVAAGTGADHDDVEAFGRRHGRV